jgi:hypothetical protein
VWLSGEKDCGVPISFWLAVYFVLISFESILKEMRDRMSESPYWYTAHRGLKKAIQNGSIILREVLETVWVIYGLFLYNDDKATGCDKENETFMWFIWAFLCIGVIKMACFGLLVLFATFVFARNCLMRKRQRNASIDIVRGLSNVKFSALMN